MASGLVWSPVKESVRQALEILKMSQQQVYDAGIAGKETIKKTIKMIKDGKAPPMWDVLPEIAERLEAVGGELGEEQGGKVAVPPGDKKGDGKPKFKETAKPVETSKMNEASFLRFVPKTFVTSSVMLWLGMQAAVECWGWPEDMTPQEFLDTFIPQAFKDYGIILASYVRLAPGEMPQIASAQAPADGQGNGHEEEKTGGDQGEEKVDQKVDQGHAI